MAILELYRTRTEAAACVADCNASSKKGEVVIRLNEKQLDAAARKLCELEGRNPDEVILRESGLYRDGEDGMLKGHTRDVTNQMFYRACKLNNYLEVQLAIEYASKI